jgi:hypothetical protein
VAGQINPNGLTIRKPDGTIVLDASGTGTPIHYSSVLPDGGWLNSAISINSAGQLSGGGGGQVTLPGLGVRTFVVQAQGSNGSHPRWLGGGLRDVDNGNALIDGGPTRSYRLVELDKTTLGVVFSQGYDVYGVGEIGGLTAASLASDLNYICDNRPGNVIVVYTHDEPRNHRLDSGLPAAMYRCGASQAVFGSANFQFRAAYILIGRAGIGEGNGVETLSSVGDAPGAWAELGFTWRAGQLTISGGGTTPRALSDYGYSGDLNATYGATWGGNLSGRPGNLAALGGGETIRNDQITISAGGALMGIGSGSGAIVSNAQMSIGVDGKLYSAGVFLGTSATLSGMGAGAMALINQITNDNVSTYIAGAAIELAQIKVASINTLSALSSFLGTVTIADGGYLRSGAVDFTSGNGFALGWVGGEPYLKVGGPSSYLRYRPSTGLELKLDTFTVTAGTSGTMGVTGNGVKSLGTITAVPTGGVAPYTYSWAVSSDADASNPAAFTAYRAESSASADKCDLKANSTAGALAPVTQYVFCSCTVTDANGRTAVGGSTTTVHWNGGTP